jgi:Ca2+:H+ antiporter
MSPQQDHPLWKETLRFSLGHWRISILLLTPAAVISALVHAPPVIVFLVAALALVPLASLLGDATEQLAGHIGPMLGGLLNATLGNVAELIIGIIALHRGQIEVVKASITGSIVGNLLLVFGLAAFVGGLRHETLSFNRTAAGANVSMLFLAVVALVMPALFQLTLLGSLRPTGTRIEHLSLWVAAVLLACYLSSFIFMFRTHHSVFRGESFATPTISVRAALILLLAAAVLTAVASEILVSQIEYVTHALGWTELFVGLVIVATVGNAAEHSTAVMMARKGQMDMALNIAVGSSAQIALFVAPLLVVISQFRMSPMSLVFHPLEITAVILSVGVVTVTSLDGETHWFEGLLLLGVYAILAVFFYFLPAPPA